MSRSNNVTATNPATRFFEWKGSKGQLKYYDKDKKENVFVDNPFTFLVLDQLATVRGWSDEANSGIWANEVRNLQNEELIVRNKLGVIARGLYSSIKGSGKGVFTKSIYIAYYDNKKKLQIGNIQASGAFLKAWIQFARGRDLYKGAVVIKGTETMKKGSNTYSSPVFEVNDKVTEATEQSAKELDKALQDYLKDYFTVRAVETELEMDDLSELEIDSSPFAGEFKSPNDDYDDEIPF